MAAALDDWASVRRSLRRDRPGALRLAEVANAVDPAPWRVGLRRALDVADRASRGKALRTLAASAKLEAMPAVDLDLLGTALSEAGESEAAEDVLAGRPAEVPGGRLAQLRPGSPPGGRSRREEAIRYYSIARALRPETALVLAIALGTRGNRTRRSRCSRTCFDGAPTMAATGPSTVNCSGNEAIAPGRWRPGQGGGDPARGRPPRPDDAVPMPTSASP